MEAEALTVRVGATPSELMVPPPYNPPFVIAGCPSRWWDLGPHLKFCFLGPHKSTSQIASCLAQLFLWASDQFVQHRDKHTECGTSMTVGIMAMPSNNNSSIHPCDCDV